MIVLNCLINIHRFNFVLMHITVFTLYVNALVDILIDNKTVKANGSVWRNL